MNKIRKTFVTLGLVFCLVFLGSSAFSRAISEQYPSITVGTAFQPAGWRSYQASWLIGHYVTSESGGILGQISGLVIDKTNGRVALVVLSDVPNIGAKVLAIPYSSITRTGSSTWEFSPGSMDLYSAAAPDHGYRDYYVYSLTRYPSYSEFYGLPTEFDIAWLTGIYEHYGQVPYWTEKGEQEPKAVELYESHRLMGAEVELPGGEAAGRIDDFVIDSSEGRIIFLVLSDVPGRPTTLVALPFSTLTARGGGAFVLNTTQEQLALASGFDESKDLNNPRRAGDIYRYFGQQPYWTEETEMAPVPAEPERMQPKPHTLEWHERYGY